MGQFANAFRNWVRGMKALKKGGTELERARAKANVSLAFNEMIAAPIVDGADQAAMDIIEAFD